MKIIYKPEYKWWASTKPVPNKYIGIYEYSKLQIKTKQLNNNIKTTVATVMPVQSNVQLFTLTINYFIIPMVGLRGGTSSQSCSPRAPL